MSENIPVHIQISGKEYKLIIQPDQQITLQQAVKIVNSTIDNYQNSPGLSLLNDALALCSVELAMRLLNSNSKTYSYCPEDLTTLQIINDELTSFLNNNVKCQ